ncbi:MAG: hypothetical protein LBR61_03215 [Synergistaceae bacterium]|jgi:hypothetical protein|nr:hypothetical protein [Synergistaceae bacterium]
MKKTGSRKSRTFMKLIDAFVENNYEKHVEFRLRNGDVCRGFLDDSEWEGSVFRVHLSDVDLNGRVVSEVYVEAPEIVEAVALEAPSGPDAPPDTLIFD